MPERVYQVSRPGRANIPLSWAFADKRIFPNFAFFGPKVDQIWQFLKFWNQPQVNTYLDYQNLKFGQKMFIVAKVILESHNFLWMHTVLKQMDNLWQQKQFWVHFNSYLLGMEWHHSMMLPSIQKRAFSDKRMILYVNYVGVDEIVMVLTIWLMYVHEIDKGYSDSQCCDCNWIAFTLGH